jgi:hypothetical protein
VFTVCVVKTFERTVLPPCIKAEKSKSVAAFELAQKMHLTPVILLVLLNLAYGFRQQSVGIRGRLMCGTQPVRSIYSPTH